MRRNSSSGQTLLTGVVMLLVLTLAALFVFDLHNVIRAKFKVETAQEAAALAGARWQQKSLNLIGELNVIKACSALLEGDSPWPEALPAEPPELRQAVLQSRIDHLTEMQTRVAFLGPLLGFAAAQQAAKANGLETHGDLSEYLELLQTDWRYQSALGGAPDVISGFRWREPYLALLSSIVKDGVAVYPNARTANNATVWPPELKYQSLYDDVMAHQEEIAASDPPDINQSSWDGLRNFVVSTGGYPFSDADYQGKWWDIDYSMAKFPNESEIYTLGITTGFSGSSGFASYDDQGRAIYRELVSGVGSKEGVYASSVLLPGRMKWAGYDQLWYPEYYREQYDDYDQNYYDYWFKADALRRPVKPQYRYEGPAAYAEGYAELGRVGLLHARSGLKNGPLQLKSAQSYRVGSRRGTGDKSSASATEYRPGNIAKPLGELANARPPIALPLVLPVFDRVSLMPTYLPIPYGFGVLRPGYSKLEKFLNWLANQNSLADCDGEPPVSGYLESLQILTQGREFRYYGWNPAFDAAAFDARWAGQLEKWPDNYGSCAYSQQNLTGPGWLQMPKFCSGDPKGVSGERTAVTDYLNGGTAVRVSMGNGRYCVVTASGHIVTNDELDPTLLYNSGESGSGGGGYGGHTNQPDTRTGPVRL